MFDKIQKKAHYLGTVHPKMKDSLFTNPQAVPNL